MQTTNARIGLCAPMVLLCLVLCGCATRTAESFLPAVGEERPPNTARIYAHTGTVYSSYWIDWGDGAPRNAIIKGCDPAISSATIPVLHYTIPPDSNLEETCIQAIAGRIDEHWEAGAYKTVDFKEVIEPSIHLYADTGQIGVRPVLPEYRSRMVAGAMIDGVWIIGVVSTKEIPLIRSQHASMTHVWREEHPLREDQVSITGFVQGDGSSANDGSSTGWKNVSTVGGTSHIKWIGKRARSNQTHTQCKVIAYELQKPASTSARECGVFIIHHEALSQGLSVKRWPVKAVSAEPIQDPLIAIRRTDGTTQLLSTPSPRMFVLAVQRDDPLWEWLGISREEIVEILTDGQPVLDACIIGHVGHGGTLVWDRPPGTLDLDALIKTPASLSGGPTYIRTPVKFSVEAGKTYHITCKWGWKFEVREETETDR